MAICFLLGFLMGWLSAAGSVVGMFYLLRYTAKKSRIAVPVTGRKAQAESAS